MSSTCSSCSTSNRAEAKYCKKCGKPILGDTVASLNGLVGAESAKKELRLLVDTVKAMRSRNAKAPIALNMHMIIMGNTGTGKTTFVKVLHELLRANGVVTKSGATTIDAASYDEFAENLSENLAQAKNSILCIDNVQKLLPGEYAVNITPLDKLFSEMDRIGRDPIVVLTGLTSGLSEYLAKNPATLNRFGYVFRLVDLSAAELLQICMKKIESFGLTVSTADAQGIPTIGTVGVRLAP